MKKKKYIFQKKKKFFWFLDNVNKLLFLKKKFNSVN